MSTRRKIVKKAWKDRRCVKIRTKWYSKNKKGCKSVKLEAGEKLNRNKEYLATIPVTFSFSKNPENTIEFLNELIHLTEKRIFKQKLYIDASLVSCVTVEALIYILAIIYNMKASKALQYSFTGNLPVDKKARMVFEKSGYLNYFRMKRLKMPDCSEYVQIVSGKIVENSIAARICDFVNQKLGKNRCYTSILYSTLIELMSNTAKHAYNEKSRMERRWYLYAIYDCGKVNIAFVDTGEGIPNTVKKKFLEKINWSLEDSSLIYSAMTQSGRSETGLKHRGRGLPNVYKHIMERKLKDFFVISGKGACKYNNETKKVERVEYKESIFGTIFRFSIGEEDDYVEN